MLRDTSARGTTNRVKTPNRKLAKILGEEIHSLPTAPGPPVQHESPWFLGDDYGPGEIVFDDRGGVRAGTLRALVARLTSHGSTGLAYLVLRTDMLTYGQTRPSSRLSFSHSAASLPAKIFLTCLLSDTISSSRLG